MNPTPVALDLAKDPLPYARRRTAALQVCGDQLPRPAISCLNGPKGRSICQEAARLSPLTAEA
jgi:hypothetical protein